MTVIVPQNILGGALFLFQLQDLCKQEGIRFVIIDAAKEDNGWKIVK